MTNLILLLLCGYISLGQPKEKCGHNDIFLSHLSQKPVPSEALHFTLRFDDDTTYKEDFERDVQTFDVLPLAWIENFSLILQGVVTIDNMHYEVFDGEGDVLLSGCLCVKKQEQTIIPLCSLQSGRYILCITIGEDTYVAEFEL